MLFTGLTVLRDKTVQRGLGRPTDCHVGPGPGRTVVGSHQGWLPGRLDSCSVIADGVIWGSWVYELCPIFVNLWNSKIISKGKKYLH